MSFPSLTLAGPNDSAGPKEPAQNPSEEVPSDNKPFTIFLEDEGKNGNPPARVEIEVDRFDGTEDLQKSLDAEKNTSKFAATFTAEENSNPSWKQSMLDYWQSNGTKVYNHIIAKIPEPLQAKALQAKSQWAQAPSAWSEFKYSSNAFSYLKWHKRGLVALRLTIYEGVFVYNYFAIMENTPAWVAGSIAAVVGGIITYYNKNYNHFFAYKGMGSFNEKWQHLDEKGEPIEAAFWERVGKWIFAVQAPVFALISATLYTFGQNGFPEAGLAVMPFVKFAAILGLSFAAQGIPEFIISDVSENKARERMDLFNEDQKKGLKPDFDRAKKDVAFYAAYANQANWFIAIASTVLVSAFMSGNTGVAPAGLLLMSVPSAIYLTRRMQLIRKSQDTVKSVYNKIVYNQTNNRPRLYGVVDYLKKNGLPQTKPGSCSMVFAM